jgi:hypothetical protein
MPFEIVGEIAHVETIAVGSRIRDLPRLRRLYGLGRWRKLIRNCRRPVANGPNTKGGAALV